MRKHATQRLTFVAQQCSTVAQMFSQELMDIFRIDNSVADLDEQVNKRSVCPQNCIAQPRQHMPPTETPLAETR